ncbi:MAG: T9SS type A sorting domain-containing protein [Bacteroidetes bacterium]|nr:T9SS type A sorting domain-containing protein [Bacteroidota bacterium]
MSKTIGWTYLYCSKYFWRKYVNKHRISWWIVVWCAPHFLPATGTTTRSSTQWWGVNPVAGSITHVGRIDDGSGATSTYYPNISVNALNDAVVSYSQFNAGYYQSASYNYRSSADANGTLPNGVFYYPGQSVDWDGRGGDYNQCVTDPNDQTAFWVVNQIPNGSWETRYSLIPGYYGCYTTATFFNTVWNGYTKNEASVSISSAEMIQSPSMVEYDAGSFVALTPGFVANEGCVFTAYINGCGGALSNSREKNTTVVTDAQSKTLEPVYEQGTIGVFPNPSSGLFNLTLNLTEDARVTITIYDATGKVVAMPLDNVGIPKGYFNKELNLENLGEGIYFSKQ